MTSFGSIARTGLSVLRSMPLILIMIASARAQEPFNIVLIMADDLGYGDISPYGGWVDTPNLQRMAEEGIRFTDFHSSGTVCSPTRAGLLTGRYQQRTGITGVVVADSTDGRHQHGLQDAEITLPELLKRAGYKTALIGKWHLGYYPKYNPTQHGFDHFTGFVSGNIDYFSHIDQVGAYDWWHGGERVNEPGYTTKLITKHAVSAIRSNLESPFFLYIAHEAPHYPYQSPDDKPERTIDGEFDVYSADGNVRRTYKDMVEELDASVGEVLRVLTETGLAERTLVLFFSDNGANEEGSNAPLRGHKNTEWEGGHRVPLIAWSPGNIRPGRVSNQLAITLDLMPTVLDLAQVSVDSQHRLDGISLLSLLFSDIELGKRKLFWNGVAMRDGVRKLILSEDRAMLFDLDSDIEERNDISALWPEEVDRMMSELSAWRHDVEQGATPQPHD